MTKEHLKLILKNTISCYFENGFLERLYEPEYFLQPIDENLLNKFVTKALCFDYKKHNLYYVDGKISCTGMNFTFKSDRFEKIEIQVFYDFYAERVINYVLAHPKYTKNDWIGKKSISHVANKVTSNKTLSNYFTRMYKRFECPVLIS